MPNIMKFSKETNLELGIFCFFLLFTLLVVPGLPLVPLKFFLAILAGVGGLIYLILSFIREREISLPGSPLLIPLGVLSVAYLLSSLLNGKGAESLFGMLSPDSGLGMLGLSILAFATFAVFVRIKRFVMVLYALTFSALIAALVQVVALLGSYFFVPFARFVSTVPTVVGGWNDLALLTGLGVLLALLISEYSNVSEKMRTVFSVGIGVSLALLLLVNFAAVWQMLAILSFLIVIHSASERSHKRGEENREFSVLPILILAISLISVLSGGKIGSYIQNGAGLSYVEARPSFETTMELSRDTILSPSAVLGSGPGNFDEVWEETKPREVNVTPFWSARFQNGFGFITSSIVTAGILGFFGFLLLIFAFIEMSRKNLSGNGPEEVSHTPFIIIMATLYLLLSLILYVPGAFIISLTFILFGVLAAVHHARNRGSVFSISWENNPNRSFQALAGLSVLFIVLLVGVYSYGENLFSVRSHGKAIMSLQAGDIQAAERHAIGALELSRYPMYYRTLSSIYDTNAIIVANDQGLSEQEKVQLLTQNIEASIVNAQAAVALNGDDFENWVVLARAYQRAAEIGVEGAAAEAYKALDEADKRAPNNPVISLDRARVALLEENAEEARRFINEALTRKSNFTEAGLLLAQIELAAGNSAEALALLEQATIIEPQNTLLRFQVGILRYSLEDFNGAARAFRDALTLDPQYANARYFYALSIYNLGYRAEALTEFRAIQSSNPENQELALIIRNLENGREPLEGATPPINEFPEQRETLPIEE